MSSFVYDVYGIGNALVDHIVCVSDDFISAHALKKGQMTEMGPRLQQEVLNACDGLSQLRQGGGSAANTLVAVAALGGRAGYACRVGDDTTGQDYLKDLQKAGLTLSPAHLMQSNQSGTGTCVVLVTPDGERTMLTHLGITKEFDTQNIDDKALVQARYVYLEGYLISTDKGFEAMQYARLLAKKEPKAQVALTLSDLSMVTYFKARFMELLKVPVDLLFCNQDEALAFTGTSDLQQASLGLRKVAHSFVITRGGDHVYAYTDGQEAMFPTYSASVLDTNGAGDIFAGGMLYALAKGFPFAKGGHLGCWAAARLVERIGARLNPKEWAKVKQWAKTKLS